jgi:hypothetical protein
VLVCIVAQDLFCKLDSGPQTLANLGTPLAFRGLQSTNISYERSMTKQWAHSPYWRRAKCPGDKGGTPNGEAVPYLA